MSHTNPYRPPEVAEAQALLAGRAFGRRDTPAGPSPNGILPNTFSIGDLLYANSVSTLARLADVATGNVLRAGGVGVAPAWGPVSLATDVTGILPVAKGGTGQSSIPCFKVNCASTTSFAANTATTVAYDTVVWDTASAFNTSTHAYTIPLSGKWRFDSNTYSVLTAPSNSILCFITVGGTRALDSSYEVMSTSVISQFISKINGELDLNAGDVLVLQVFGAGAGTVQSSATATWWSGRYVGG